jgi:hypothetical protein
LEKKENKKQKKPLKLSSAGRLQLRKNLGPSRSVVKSKQGEKGKTIQVVFRNKNNERQRSSTAKSNFRGSSISRSPLTPSIVPASKFPLRTNKNFVQKNKKNIETKKIIMNIKFLSVIGILCISV